MNTSFIRRSTVLFLALLTWAAAPLHAQREKLSLEDLEMVEQKWPKTQRTRTGLRYIVLHAAPDNMPSPVIGDTVKVVYKGMLLDGTVFDKTDAEHPLVTRLGRGALIDGWEEALQKMRKGEKWLLIVPHELAYGSRGRPPAIPRRATLIFEMELQDFGPELK